MPRSDIIGAKEMRDEPAIQYMTTDDAETVNACLCLVYRLMYSEEKIFKSDDDRVTQERLLEVVSKLMPDREFH
tara:strand:+ start:21682 stop:21903 length:222 start_codon:yes stop_codon:yes gene_type:complete